MSMPYIFNAYTDFVIIGREGCGYCVKAKELLEKLGLTYMYVDAGGKEERVSLLTKLKPLIGEHNTFPVVFRGGVFIGGFSDLDKYLVTSKVTSKVADDPPHIVDDF